ncbi:putative short-chain oxidoreductase [Hypoxylon sp. FL0890]|nr:putative short-chain oxidoreductase [Hypoxylon sp. FL0890]
MSTIYATFTKPKTKLTWFITGFSSGFGLSLTRIALANGYNVIATSCNPSRAPELVAEVQSKGGRWLKLDVDDHNSADVIEGLEKEGYSIFSPVEIATEEEIRGQMESITGASLDGRDTMEPCTGAKAGLDGITTVLAKEVAPFNIRTLTVILSAFNTNMASAATFLTGGKSGIQFNLGDKYKAIKAVCEVVVGKGVGAGREAERILPPGSDMVARVNGVWDALGPALEAFKHVTSNVGVDK